MSFPKGQTPRISAESQLVKGRVVDPFGEDRAPLSILLLVHAKLALSSSFAGSFSSVILPQLVFTVLVSSYVTIVSKLNVSATR